MRLSTLRRLDAPTLRAALWALRALRAARRGLASGGIEAPLALPPVPGLPAAAVRGVEVVLRRRDATCLERASVLQVWYRAHGEPRQLIIGVTAPSRGFLAHAWLEGDSPCHTAEFSELLRLPAA